MIQRCRDGEEWIGIGEVTVDHRLMTVAKSGDEHDHARKFLEKARQRKEVPSSLKKVVSLCFLSYLQSLLNEFFFKKKKNLIQNKGIGHSWKHTPLFILLLRKPK